MARDYTEDNAKMAPRYKTAFIVWLAVSPTVYVFLILVSQLPFELPLILRVFFITGFTVLHPGTKAKPPVRALVIQRGLALKYQSTAAFN